MFSLVVVRQSYYSYILSLESIFMVLVVSRQIKTNSTHFLLSIKKSWWFMKQLDKGCSYIDNNYLVFGINIYGAGGFYKLNINGGVPVSKVFSLK